ncbi:MAG: DUF427 domain-containing protein [Pseudomonadota bacterium]
MARCPASYRSIVSSGRRIEDAAWCYPEPMEDALRVGDHLCFNADGVLVEVDGESA